MVDWSTKDGASAWMGDSLRGWAVKSVLGFSRRGQIHSLDTLDRATVVDGLADDVHDATGRGSRSVYNIGKHAP